MEVVNPFILKNKERMIVFLDQLSSVTDPNPPPNSYIEASTSHLCSDAGKTLHAHNIRIYQIISFFLFARSWTGYITSHLRFVYEWIAGNSQNEHITQKTGHRDGYVDEAQDQVYRNDKLIIQNDGNGRIPTNSSFWIWQKFLSFF